MRNDLRGDLVRYVISDQDVISSKHVTNIIRQQHQLFIIDHGELHEEYMKARHSTDISQIWKTTVGFLYFVNRKYTMLTPCEAYEKLTEVESHQHGIS